MKAKLLTAAAACMIGASITAAFSLGGVSAAETFTEENIATTQPASFVPAYDMYGFSVDTREVVLEEGETYQLKVSIDYDFYQPKSLRFQVVDTGTGNYCASVDHNGLITAVTEGEIYINIIADLDREAAGLWEHATTERKLTVKVTVRQSSEISEDVQAAIRDLRLKENRLIGELPRAKKVLLGEMSADAPRIDLETALDIMENSETFEEILQKINDKYGSPDYIGGSGNTNIEYWFDDRGCEKLSIIYEQAMINYTITGNDGRAVLYLFMYRDNPWHPVRPGDNEPMVFSDDSVDRVDYNYAVYNDIYDAIVQGADLTCTEDIDGDVNRDGVFSMADVVLVQRWLLDNSSVELKNIQAVDFCKDDKLDIFDFCIMKKKLTT